MSERAAHGGLAGAGRPVKQHASFRPQLVLVGQRIVFQGQDDIDFQVAQDVIHPFEVGQIDGLDLAEVHVAGEALGSQVFNERVRAEFFEGHQPLAGSFQLVGVELGREPEDFLEVQFFGSSTK